MPRKRGQTGARGDEDGVEALLGHQLVDGDRAPDDDVGLEANAHLAQRCSDLAPDDVLRQAELGDAVDEDAADLVQGLEDGDLVAALDEVARGAEGRGAAADDGDPLAGGRVRWAAVRSRRCSASQSAMKRSR